MAIKLKFLIWGSKACCIITFVAAATVLGIAVFLYISDERRISVPVILAWYSLLAKLIGLSVIVIIMSIFWFWGASQCHKDDKVAFGFVMVTLIIVFLIGLYLSAKSSVYRHVKPLSKDEVFNSTRSTISEGILENGNSMWVPPWLTAIQEKSRTCCGVRTFKDWDEFWKPIRNHIPKSCCKSIKEPNKCHTELDSIPYPDTVANNIKVEAGCYADINARIHELVYQAFVLALIMTIFLGTALVAFLLEYVFALLQTTPMEESNEPLFLTEEQAWASSIFSPAGVKKIQSGDLSVMVQSSSAEIILKNFETSNLVAVDEPDNSGLQNELKDTINHHSQSQHNTDTPSELLEETKSNMELN